MSRCSDNACIEGRTTPRLPRALVLFTGSLPCPNYRRA
jgi:hypothetical protein